MSTLASTLVAGRYRLVRSLGHGAMAEVWEANDELLQRRVAVKILHPHLRRPAMIERFRAEGLATARLRHPAIVTVFDTITQPDLDAIVMELVEGRTLRFVLDQRGTLPIDRAVHIVATVADALHAAHIDRASSTVTSSRRTSFSARTAPSRSPTSVSPRATSRSISPKPARTSAPRAMSHPSKCAANAPTARSDIYALGTVLYESLVGQSPFVADHDDALALARLHRERTVGSRVATRRVAGARRGHRPRTRRVSPAIATDRGAVRRRAAPICAARSTAAAAGGGTTMDTTAILAPVVDPTTTVERRRSPVEHQRQPTCAASPATQLRRVDRDHRDRGDHRRGAALGARVDRRKPRAREFKVARVTPADGRDASTTPASSTPRDAATATPSSGCCNCTSIACGAVPQGDGQRRRHRRRHTRGAARHLPRHHPIRRALVVQHVDLPCHDQRLPRRAPAQGTAADRHGRRRDATAAVADRFADDIADRARARRRAGPAQPRFPSRRRAARPLPTRLRRDRATCSASHRAPCVRASPRGRAHLARFVGDDSTGNQLTTHDRPKQSE